MSEMHPVLLPSIAPYEADLNPGVEFAIGMSVTEFNHDWEVGERRGWVDGLGGAEYVRLLAEYLADEHDLEPELAAGIVNLHVWLYLDGPSGTLEEWKAQPTEPDMPIAEPDLPITYKQSGG